MTPQTHAMLGTAVLVVSLLVGIWLIFARRTDKTASPSLTVALIVVLALLGIQILAGVDLLSRGDQPAPGALAIVHVGGPIIAFLVGLWALLAPPRARILHYIVAVHLTFLVSLISFAIGMAFIGR
ncbi:MAG: hypothetical protein ACREOS_04900 [Candidatus Dormibacteraceae bacterium]